jgi:hypothetical protein
MKKGNSGACVHFFVLIGVFFFTPIQTYAQENYGFANYESKEHKEYQMKIDDIAMQAATITGTAINPLLISGAIGFLEYSKTTDEEKNKLPWYYQRWFFIMCFVMVGIAFVPSALLSPFGFPPQISAFFESSNKVVGLAFSSPIIFDIVTRIADSFSGATQTSMNNQTMPYIAASIIPLNSLENIYFVATVILLSVSFFAIWAMNFLFDILIMLSPFGWFDLLLKFARGIFFALLVALTFFAPILVIVLFVVLAIIAFIGFFKSFGKIKKKFATRLTPITKGV